MKCMYCKGELELGEVPFQTRHEGYNLTLERVPAWVCTQCGEHLFDMKQAKAIQETLKLMDERAESIRETA